MSVFLVRLYFFSGLCKKTEGGVSLVKIAWSSYGEGSEFS